MKPKQEKTVILVVMNLLGLFVLISFFSVFSNPDESVELGSELIINLLDSNEYNCIVIGANNQRIELNNLAYYDSFFDTFSYGYYDSDKKGKIKGAKYYECEVIKKSEVNDYD